MRVLVEAVGIPQAAHLGISLSLCPRQRILRSTSKRSQIFFTFRFSAVPSCRCSCFPIRHGRRGCSFRRRRPTDFGSVLSLAPNSPRTRRAGYSRSSAAPSEEPTRSCAVRARTRVARPMRLLSSLCSCARELRFARKPWPPSVIEIPLRRRYLISYMHPLESTARAEDPDAVSESLASHLQAVTTVTCLVTAAGPQVRREPSRPHALRHPLS